MHWMQGPEVDEAPPEVLSEDEITALLRACEGKTFEDRRDLADSGLRRFEAAGSRLLSNEPARLIVPPHPEIASKDRRRERHDCTASL
jgi:integrase